LPFVIRLGEQDSVTARAGLPLVVEALRAVRLEDALTGAVQVARRERGFTAAQKVTALTLLIAAGGDRVEDIRILSEDRGLLRLLGQDLPSPDALLDFLNAFDDPALTAGRPPEKAAWVPPESAALQGLAAVNRTLVARVADPAATVATIDHDGTIIESHKRAARLAYEGTRGYQPLVAIWQEQDLIVADEFRDGNVAGGEDPLTSVQRAFAALPAGVQTRYFRGDTADYYTPLLKWLVAEGIGFVIGADLSKELRAQCEAVPTADWQLLERRATEDVHLAEVEFTPGDWAKTAAPLRYVTVRFTPHQEELFAARGPKYLAVVSNRTELTPADLVEWYWGKAGTVEHTHRVLKDELAAGVLPCGRFAANAAWFRLNAITYNVLTLLRRRALPARYADARPKRLRFEVFTLPGRLTLHQRQLTVSVSASPARSRELIEARQRLLALYDASAAG
jgi:hypothetical protein